MDPMNQHYLCFDDNPRVNTMHCFGNHIGMTYSGPDVSCAGTLRLTAPMSAERAVLSFPFHDAYHYVKLANQGSASSDPKMADAINFIRVRDQDSPETPPLKIYHGLFDPHSFVYQPPGFIMLEKTLGNIVTGVVATVMPCSGQTSTNLQALVNLTQGVSIQGTHHAF